MRTRVLILCTLLLSSFAAFARTRPAPTAPGTYKEWGPDIDQIEILQPFKTADYDRIVIEPFDTSSTPLPDAKEKWYGTMKSALASYNVWFVEAFEPELKAKAKVEESDHAAKRPGTLVIRGTVLDMDPGSRAGRYFAGFGAGAASSKASVEIVDAKSGKVLARVTQARRSGGAWKGAGGSDLEVMRDSVHATAKDIAHVLDTF
ncbi:MAG TPA: DUF4410 domain-containing protein [Thermoanaerobaculia bacterium]|nr:DUF4410 domain-containing protein [Thermoanaerobaculia bacterium]